MNMNLNTIYTADHIYFYTKSISIIFISIFYSHDDYFLFVSFLIPCHTVTFKHSKTCCFIQLQNDIRTQSILNL
jgi:hypothetical protein